MFHFFRFFYIVCVVCIYLCFCFLFLKLVWRDTKSIGMGKSTFNRDGSVCTYVVARYKPKGNFIKEYESNVLRGSFDAAERCKNIDSLLNIAANEFGSKNYEIPVLFSNEGDKSLFGGNSPSNTSFSLSFDKEAIHAAMTEALKDQALPSDNGHRKYLQNLKNFELVSSNITVGSSMKHAKNYKLIAADMLHRVDTFLSSNIKLKNTRKKLYKRKRIHNK